MLKNAVQTLKNNGIVIFPTDTAYALGCVFDNAKAKQRIMRLKKRKDPKFTLVASSLHQVEKYFKLNSLEKKLAKQHWPGAYSIVVNDKYAVRVPANKLARSLARRVGKPLVATSLNVSGQKNQGALYSWLSRVDCTIDVGKLKNKKPSTIVKVKNKEIIIIRK